MYFEPVLGATFYIQCHVFIYNTNNNNQNRRVISFLFRPAMASCMIIKQQPVSHEASVVELGGGGGGIRAKRNVFTTERSEGAYTRGILVLLDLPNIVFPGHLRTKILSFVKRKIRRISITQLLSCILITNDTYYVQLSVHSVK